MRKLLLFVFLALLTLAGCEDNLNLPPLLLETGASWSPDGSTIAYYRNPVYASDTVGIWLVDSDGTNDRYLCNGIQADWSPDGKRLAIATAGWCIFLVAKDSSNFEWLIQDGQSNSPAWSPDGKWIAFVRPFVSDGLRLINLETRKETGIPGISSGDWSPNSRLWVHFWKSGKSEQAIKITDIQDSIAWTVREFDIYEDGALEGIPRWSPDGKKVLFMMGLDTWIVDTSGDNLKKLAEYAANPNWSPDGSKIVFTKCDEDGRLWIMDTDGKNQRPLREE